MDTHFWWVWGGPGQFWGGAGKFLVQLNNNTGVMSTMNLLTRALVHVVKVDTFRVTGFEDKSRIKTKAIDLCRTHEWSR